MQYSDNLHLNLPEDTDPLEVSKLSENFERLDAAVADAGTEAAAKAFQVGDILTTWRTDLGADWLLCNGDPFDPAEYPGLAEVTPGVGTMAELNRAGYEFNNQNSQVISCSATDGETVAICTTQDGLLYSSDGFHTVTRNPVVTNFNKNYNRMFYTNGHWIIAVQSYTSGTFSFTGLLETTDISGEWTLHKFTAAPGFIQHIEYCGGEYWAFGTAGPVALGLWYGSFHDFNITGIVKNNISVTSALRDFYGYFVRSDKFEFFCYYPRSNKFYRVTAEAPDGPWVQSDAITFSAGSTSPDNFQYSDGRFYGGCSNYDGSSSSTYKRGLFVFDGNAVKYSLRSFNNATSVSLPVYAGGCVIGSLEGSSIDVFDENTEQITAVKVNGNNSAIMNSGQGTLVRAKNSIVGSMSTSVGSTKKYSLINIPLYAVPEISLPQSYTYIKAKEGGAGNGNQQTEAPAP